MRVRRIGVFWIKLAVFLCLLMMMCNAVGMLLSGDIDNTKYSDALRHLPRNSVDVLWMGSSHMFCGVIPQMLYDEYGVASTMLCMSAMSFEQMYWALKETLRCQSPDVVIMDLYTATVPYSYGDPFDEVYLNRPERFYPGTSAYNGAGRIARWLPLGSPYKPFAMWETNRQYGIIPAEMFEITKMHERYGDIRQYDFQVARGENTYTLDFGFDFCCNTLSPNTILREDYTLAKATRGQNILWNFTEEQLAEVELLPKIRQNIEQIIWLTRERGIKLVFCVVPYVINAAESQIYQQLARIAQEEDVPFVGANAIQIEYEQLADMGHLNVEGAMRYTSFWGEELLRRFDLPDRRQSTDRRYAAWRDHTGRYLAQIAARREYGTMSEYLEMLTKLDDDFLILLGFQGSSHERFTEDDYWLLVEELGVPEDVLAQWYDTGEGTLNTLIHNKQLLASNYDQNDWEDELRWNVFGNAVSIRGGEHKVNQKLILNNSQDGMHITVFSLSSSRSINQISFDLTQVGE